MQASILRRRSSFEVGSEMEGRQRRQTGGGRESARMWKNLPDVEFEEEAWEEKSPLEQL